MAEHDLVSMTYTGTNAGPITFTVNGRTYRGANNDSDRTIQAHPDDVEGLENLHLWKRTPEAPKAAQAEPKTETKNDEQPQSDTKRRNVDKG